MSTIYLLKYNNYYNRIVKKEDTLGAYLTQDCLLDTFENVNFVPADGVDTTLVVKHEGPNPDYLIVADGNDIESRWFVVESDIIRGGQYRLTLHRDVIVDSYDLVVNAPCFIEKATLSNDDPFIFNSENMTFNQIKQSETLLKDETQSAWVVGYIPKDAFPDGATVTGDAILDDSADITVAGIENWEYYQYQNTDFNALLTDYTTTGEVRIKVTSSSATAPLKDVPFGITKGGIAYLDTITPGAGSPGYSVTVPYNQNDTIYAAEKAIKNGCPQQWNTGVVKASILLSLKEDIGAHSITEISDFTSLNNKIIYDSNTQLYSRVILSKEIKNESVRINSSTIPNLYTYLDEKITKEVSADGMTFTIEGAANVNTYKTDFSYEAYRITLEQIPQQVTATISKPAARYHLEDQPYDMFAIPYSDDLEIYKNGTKLFNANKSIAVNIATQITAATGSANVYDVQLLPYCPVRYCILADGTFDVKTAKVDYVQDKNKNNIGIILWATTSSFTVNINKEITSTNPKIENMTDRWRLCSPNFNGQFEFSVAMNGGVDYFNVDCTYKPFNPYIHVNPNFKKMYGQDFNDARGLICAGDFSLPQVTNAWADYQLNNKNYENIFNREIQNLQVQQKAQRAGDIASVFGGIASGSAGGALAGVGGAIAGGLISAIGGAADIAINEKLRAEAMDYKRDMFGMQMGNIQALPSNITKTTAFTYNNKIFPILEYYTCTDEEKTALTNKLKYNGMTVGRIGKISDYLANANDQYIKGRIIRIEGVSDDFHYYKAISDEIYKGAFF